MADDIAKAGKPGFWTRTFSFLILVLAWLAVSKIFHFFVPSWPQGLLHDIVIGCVWALLSVFFSPTLANLSSDLRPRPRPR